jgi:hypothetical protein
VGGFTLADAKVVMSQELVITAYAADTGARSWSLDLSAAQPTGYDYVGGMTDLGNGKIAFTRYAYSAGTSSVFIVDAASGSVLWSSAAPGTEDYQILASNGAGSMLVTSKSPADVAVLDSLGGKVWTQRLPDRLLSVAWPSGMPWLSVAGSQSICPTANYTAAPGWFGLTMGADLGFAFSFGATARSPATVEVFRGRSVLATGPLEGTNSYDSLAVLPFLAGDHINVLGQRWHSIPALCHPSAPGAAWFARVDATSLYQCPLTFEGDSGIVAAALLRGRLIIGRVTYLTFACSQELQPVTIEAYALPGESLAPAGWVQMEGSPGLGRRPLAP